MGELLLRETVAMSTAEAWSVTRGQVDTLLAMIGPAGADRRVGLRVQLIDRDAMTIGFILEPDGKVGRGILRIVTIDDRTSAIELSGDVQLGQRDEIEFVMAAQTGFSRWVGSLPSTDRERVP